LTVFVVLGVFDINLPEAMLAGSSLDSDLLLGVMCAVILMPAVCELTSS
jgi:hypothetical protein